MFITAPGRHWLWFYCKDKEILGTEKSRDLSKFTRWLQAEWCYEPGRLSPDSVLTTVTHQPNTSAMFLNNPVWNLVLFLYRIASSISSVQSLSPVRLFATPWTSAHQAFLSNSHSQSLLKLMSIEPVMPSYHLILCHPLLLQPSFFPSIRVFSSESVLHIRWPTYWSLFQNVDILLVKKVSVTALIFIL